MKKEDYHIKQVGDLFFIEHKEIKQPLGVHGGICYEGYNDHHLCYFDDVQHAINFFKTAINPIYHEIK